ncbi:MAG: sodium/proton-translocating pyrophosphatase, partial [Endomicrobiia bacterium]
MVTLFTDLTSLFVAIFSGIIGVIFVFFLIKKILSSDAGTEQMQTISLLVRKGAIAFLTREYKSVLYFLIVLFLIIFFG